MVMTAESMCRHVVYKDPQNSRIGVDGKMMRLVDPWEQFSGIDQPSRKQ